MDTSLSVCVWGGGDVGGVGLMWASVHQGGAFIDGKSRFGRLCGVGVLICVLVFGSKFVHTRPKLGPWNGNSRETMKNEWMKHATD